MNEYVIMNFHIIILIIVTLHHFIGFQGLKKNFDAIFKVYQGLSLYTDTVAKRLRKGKLERDLRQIEQDIHLMESTPEIYISDY